MSKGAHLINLTGKTFGVWKVLGQAPTPPGKNRSAHWKCVCECGAERVVKGARLRNGRSRSCGCKRARTDSCGERGIWNNMKRRCLDQNDKGYPRYGGRGIRVCERWLLSFENFYADMGPRPSADYTLDRINNDGDYEPHNCRWATWFVQARNRSNARYVMWKGAEVKLAALIAEESVVGASLVYNRLAKGMPIEEALLTPIRKPLAINKVIQRRKALQGVADWAEGRDRKGAFFGKARPRAVVQECVELGYLIDHPDRWELTEAGRRFLTEP